MIVKKKKTTDGIDQISSWDLPPSLPNEVKDVEFVQKEVLHESESEWSPAKKLKCSDLEEWLDDVYFVSEERERVPYCSDWKRGVHVSGI